MSLRVAFCLSLLSLATACGRDGDTVRDDASSGGSIARAADAGVHASPGGTTFASPTVLVDAGASKDGTASGLPSPVDGGHAMNSGSADAGSPASQVPTLDCGFVDWSTPFTWPTTSISMAVLQTEANSAVERFIGSPEVLDRGDTWDMFYAMSDSAKVGRVGHATSQDRGRSWTRTDDLLAPYGTYASGFLDTPTALYEEGRFRVYVFGNSQANVAANPGFPTPGGQIGEVELAARAWSFPMPELSLTVGAKSAWDGLWVESPVVKRVGSAYFMWYTANDQSWTVRHGVATSLDGRTWTKSADNPVVSPSTDNARFDSFFPGGTSVAQAPNGTFLMFFACASRASTAMPPLVANLCLATSPANDGKHFHMVPSDASPAPIIARSYFEGLSEGGVRVVNGPINPSVVLDRQEGVFKLYYENQSSYVGLLTLPVCRGM